MNPRSNFESQIESLDRDLFSAIPSQTSEEEKVVLLAIQRAIRRRFPAYAYLEIGSHLGGTIQPYLLDPRCSRIYSIDSRPYSQPDNRGIDQVYPANSTQAMLDRLSGVASDQMQKIVCFECESRNLTAGSIQSRPQICLIDGEHTNPAVLADFQFCHSIIDPNGVVVFHDSDLVYEAVQSVTTRLRDERLPFKGLKLAGSVFAIALGDCPVGVDPFIVRSHHNQTLFFLKSRVRLRYKRYRNRKRKS